MARKPQPGGDRNAWGLVMNEFLDTAHNPDGTIKPAGVQTAVATEVETALAIQVPPAVADAVAADSTVAAAAAAAIDAEPRVSALIADTDALTTSMATVEPAVSNLNTRTFDFRAYGDVVAAPSAALISAINEANAYGGGTVAVAAGYYNMELPVQLKDNVQLQLADGAVMDFTGMVGHLNNAAIYGTGAMVPLPAISVEHGASNHTLSFSSAHGLQPGDVVMLYNPANYSFSNARDYYRNGEFVRVAWAQSTTQVILTSPLQTTHPTTTEVYKIDPIRTGVTGGEFKFKWMAAGIRVRLGVDLNFENLNLHGSIMNQLWIDRCYNVSVNAVHAREFNDPYLYENTHYGIIIGNSQNVFMDNCFLESGRHGLTTGGDPNVGCVPCRNIQISNSYVTGWGWGDGAGTQVSVAGMALHGNIEHFQATDCIFPQGASLGGNFITMDNCEVGSNRYGAMLRGGEMSGADYRITNNRFTASKNPIGQYFIEFSWGYATTAIGDTLVFSDNSIDLGTFYSTSTQSIAVYIDNSNGNLNSNNNAVANNNVIRSRRGTAPNPFYSIWVRGAIRNVEIDGLNTNMTLRVTDFAGQTLKLNDVLVTDPYQSGMDIAVAASAYSRPTIVMDNAHVFRSGGCGISVAGATNWGLYMSDCIARDSNLGALEAGVRSSSMYLHDFQEIIRKNAIVGSIGATQTYTDSVRDTLRFTDVYPAVPAGNAKPMDRTGIGTSRVVSLPAYA